jgi:hypothetical protein
MAEGKVRYAWQTGDKEPPLQKKLAPRPHISSPDSLQFRLDELDWDEQEDNLPAFNVGKAKVVTHVDLAPSKKAKLTKTSTPCGSIQFVL